MSDVEERAAVVERVYRELFADVAEVTYWDLVSLAPTCQHARCWNAFARCLDAFAGEDLPP